MRSLVIFALTVIPAVAQNPEVRLINPSRPASQDFQIGDRFEIVITGAASQPVSVRTTRASQGTDWGPVTARTDSSGRWSMSGQFEKGDFGTWEEVWTVGGKLATPALNFSVSALSPCLKGGQVLAFQSGPNTLLTCETAEGRQTFGTPSSEDPFRTPDGRLVLGHRPSNSTAEQYHAEIIEYLITSRPSDAGAQRFLYGDQAGDLILKLIGPNALNENETRNVLSIVHAAFEMPEFIPEDAKDPSRTLLLLQALADSTNQEDLKNQIAETLAYVQSR